jgi:type VI protein secretion system component Hcp
MDEQGLRDDARETALEDLDVDRAQGEQIAGGRGDFHEIVITHPIDKSTPVLR